MINRIILLLISVMIAACSEQAEPELIRVEKWHELNRPVEEYVKLQPDRPILVFYNSDWGLTGKVAQERMKEPRFYDLFTEYKVLPLLADATDRESLGTVELMKLAPEAMILPCFTISRAGEKVSWFSLNGVDSDAIYELLESQLAE